MPLRNSDFISSVLALAEPVPLTVAILIEKSLIRAARAAVGGDIVSWVFSGSGDLGFLRRHGARLVGGLRPVQLGLLHVPGGGRAALGAQPAVHAQILVLD